MRKKFSVMLILLAVIIAMGFSSLAFAGTGNVRNHVNVDEALTALGVIDVDDGKSIVKVMGNIHVPEDRIVAEDVVAVMGNIVIDGQVNGDVVAVMGDITVNNAVQGDVVSVMGNIQKGPEAKIYGKSMETEISEMNFGPGTEHLNFLPAAFGSTFHWGFKFFNLVTLFALGSLVLALMPDKIKNMAVALGHDPLRKLLIGFIALIATPIIVIITAITLNGLPLVPVLILAFVAAKFLGYVAVALYLGSRIRNTAALNLNIFLELLLGVLILWLINLIPIVGILSAVLVTVFALGLVLDSKFGTNNPWFKKRNFEPIPTSKENEEEIKPEE